MLTFALNYWFGGLDVTGYHLVNFGFHLATVVALYFLLRGLLDAPLAGANREPATKQLLAFWGSAIWAVHPAHTQAVTYIVQRMTVMATLFYILACLLFVLTRRGRIGTTTAMSGIGVCFALGLLSKPIVATLPVALICLELVFFTPRLLTRNPGWGLAVIVVVTGVGGFFLNGRLPDWFTTYPHRDFSPVERLMTEPRVLWQYLGVYLYPALERLHVDYDVTVSRSLFQPLSTGLAIAGLTVLAGGAWLLKQRFPMACFAVLFFLIASAIEASFVNIEIAFIHRLYLPSVFLAVGALSLVPSVVRQRANLLLMLLAAGLISTTIARNEEWNSALILWSKDLDRGASNSRAMLNQVSTLNQLGQSATVLASLDNQTLAGSSHERMLLRYQQGVAYFQQGDYAAALAVFDQLLAQHSPHPEFSFHAGLIHLIGDRPDAAVSHLADLRRIAPGHAFIAVLEAKRIQSTGDPEQAARFLTGALAELPGNRAEQANLLRIHLADALLASGNHEGAYRHYLDVVRISPDNYHAWTQIYRMQRAAGDQRNAAKIERFLESKHVLIPVAD